MSAPARVGLACLPTPVTPAPRLAEALGIEAPLWVKRDDLTGFAVAGNKARPLEYLIATAREQSAQVVVSGGTPASNFCQGLAAAARWAGLRLILCYAGSRRPARHPNHLAAVRWGAEIRWTNDPDRTSVDRLIDTTVADLEADGVKALRVPRGGGTPTSMAGFHHAAAELADQVPDASLVCIAVGSGGSHAGLVSGTVALGRRFQVVGVSVSRPVHQVRARGLEMALSCANAVGTPAPGPADIDIIDGIGPGHGIASAEGTRMGELALATTGLVLDPVYSAKALAGLPEIVARCRPSGSVVFWHTGGLLDAVGQWWDESKERA